MSGVSPRMDAPAVSATIIFWNARAFLAEAIESVLAQTFADWELLLVDDGSDDGSSDIATAYATRDPRIRYHEHPGHANRGMSASRNVGLATARGRYVAFLDADDVWLPNALADQAAILDANPTAAMVYGPIEYWHSWTGAPADRGRDRVEDLGVPANRLFHPPRLVALFVRDRAAVPSGIMIRREIAERVGGFEVEFRGEYEDQVFCTKVCLVEPVFPAASCWYRYRQHDDSAVAIGLRTGSTDAARATFLDWLEAYLAGSAKPPREVVRALRIERWRFAHPALYAWLRRAERSALGGPVRAFAEVLAQFESPGRAADEEQAGR